MFHHRMRCCGWFRRKGRCKKCLVLLLVVVCVILYVGYTTVHHNQCSEEDSHRLIKNLCKLYDNHQVAGSFCSHLCQDHYLHYDKCTNYKGGKKVIFMTCDNVCQEDETVEVVFKTKGSLDEVDHIPYIFQSELRKSLKTFYKLLYDLVQHSFYDNIGVNVTDDDPLSFSWGWNFEKYLLKNGNNENATFVGADSIFTLVSQYEYAFMKLYADHTFMPKIYGTCGPAYLVEFTETLSKFEYYLIWSAPMTWKQSVNIALKLIDLMHMLDHDLHQPLHLCDVKPGNFGLRYKSQVSLIDVDCAMFEDKLLEQFMNSNCTTNDDCDFFDCKGSCDVATNRCLQKRTNNNMQSVCEDVFVGPSSRFPTGLLRDPPPHRKVEVFDALYACAYPGGSRERHTTRLPAPQVAVDKLKQVLQRSITS